MLSRPSLLLIVHETMSPLYLLVALLLLSSYPKPAKADEQPEQLKAVQMYEDHLTELRSRAKREGTAADPYEPYLEEHIRMLKRFAAVTLNESDTKSVVEGKLFSNATACEQRRIVFLGGGTASGKSSATKHWRAMMESSPCGFVIVDPDEIMMEMPEWSELSAKRDKCASDKLHSLSSRWAKEFYSKAVKSDLNIVLDGTMANARKIFDYEKELRNRGYEIFVVSVTVDIPIAANRAWDRALANNRFVPICAIMETHTSFSAAFPEYAKIFPNIKLYDTNTPGEAHLIFVNRTVIDTKLFNKFLAKANATEKEVRGKIKPQAAKGYDSLNSDCGSCSISGAVAKARLHFASVSIMLMPLILLLNVAI